MNATVQSLLVAAIVLACTWRVLRGLAPTLAWRAQAWVAYGFERPGRPAWAHRLGLWLRPEIATGGGCGSGPGSGCAACGSCAPATKPAATIPSHLVG